VHDRQWLSQALEDLGFSVLPSKANFVFARHPEHAGATLLEKLRAKKILVRQFNRPRIADYLRISVGTPEECQTLIKALKEILESPES